MAKPKMQTITRKDWDKKHKDFKLIGKDKIPYIMVYDNGTKLIPVKIIEGEMEESVASAIDQIRQDSKDIRDFLKKVFSDSDFRAMKNDKDFVQYLKSIYEGVSVNERNSSVNKRRAGAELKQKLKGKRSDGMGKYTATIYGLDSKGKRVELKSLNDLNKYSKFELDESVVNEGKFKKDDLVYNKRTKTVGIVRLGDDKSGEVKTDADGNVDVDELEKYNPIKNKHQNNAKVAPSTEKEVSKRGLFNPFKNESVNEGLKHNDMYTMLDIAAGYSSTQDQAANQMWSDEQDLYDYLKSDHIPKKYHKKFYNDIKRRFKGVSEGKDDFMARHGKADINLKKGYKHHSEDELTKLYDKVGKLAKDKKIKKVDVIFEAKEDDVITQLRKIVKDKQNALVVDTKSKKKVRVDMQSANVMVQVYDALKQQSNKDKFVKSGIVAMGHMAYKLMKNEGVNEGDGLWANIRAKKARGGKPAHKNSKAHKDAVKAGDKIKKDESVNEAKAFVVMFKVKKDINNRNIKPASAAYSSEVDAKKFLKSVEKDGGKAMIIRSNISGMKVEGTNLEHEIYFKSYTHAIEAAEVMAGKKGYTIEDDELFNKVGMNSKRPSVGKTTKVNLELLKNGKPQKKMLHIQVYGMKNGYELNAYIN